MRYVGQAAQRTTAAGWGEESLKLVALDAEEHARFRVRPLPAEIPHFVEIMTGEFAAAAAVCPIFLTKNAETGAFYAGALFGFKPGENLVAGAGDGP